MSINSVLNYSPFLRQPYAGTEEGLASNVFCENVSGLVRGEGLAQTGADPAVTIQLTNAAIDVPAGTYTLLETLAVSQSGTSGSGVGMTVKFRFTSPGASPGPFDLTLIVVNPGTGYKVNDTVTFSNAAILAALKNGGADAFTPSLTLENTATITAGDCVFVLSQHTTNENKVLAYSPSNYSSMGWQFILDAHNTNTQTVLISVKDPTLTASIDALEETSTIHANTTSSANNVADDQIGGACSTALDKQTNGTDEFVVVTVVRFAPSGFTLANTAMTVRRGKRQLKTAS